MQENIRNFSIIAHIDHGKSTIADRFIQVCGGLTDREMSAQVLDSMDLEQERGITIKAQAVSLDYTAANGTVYHLNFIDTPGHVDFSYEVSRSLSACEGALLVVDASQGVEAQSVANCYTAIEQDLEVIPDAQEAIRVSAKTGIGINDVLEQLVELIPPPGGSPDNPAKALIIDSWFDAYVGVITLVRVVEGRIRKREKIQIMSTGRTFQADTVGVFTPKRTPRDELCAGEVGFIIAGIKEIEAARVGDTITVAHNAAEEALPGFKEVQPRVFAGMYPINADDYEMFREALQKLRLNDAALAFEPETSTALGFGFRCGFLGMLHMEIVQERLEREYNLDLITLSYEIPLSEVVLDFFDRLKSVSKGYASFDYEFVRFQAADLVKVDILINGDKVDALASIIHKDRSQSRGRDLTEKMKEIIPRQMFEVAVQAAIGGHIIARTNIKALRKNVTAKCYGGDITRKRKLLEKQKAGKRRMKQVGRVEIPQEAFLAVLQVDRG